MEFFTCINKCYDKNKVILGYQLQNKETGEVIEVDPKVLKQNIYNKKVVVDNLKLTSDYRLIDNKDTKSIEIENNGVIESESKPTFQLPRNINQVLDSYQSNDKVRQNKLNYVMNKINSKRVGKAMTRALLLGLMCTSVMTVTGCSNVANADTSVAIEQAVNKKVSNVINKLNEAKVIKIDAKNFIEENKIAVYADEEEIGEILGSFLTTYDKLSFIDKNGSNIATGDIGLNDAYKNWAIYDEDNNFKYGFHEDASLLEFKNSESVYNLCDVNNNIVAVLRENEFNPSQYSADIITSDGELIARILQESFAQEFMIEIIDDSKIDAVTIATISTNFMIHNMFTISDNETRY